MIHRCIILKYILTSSVRGDPSSGLRSKSKEHKTTRVRTVLNEKQLHTLRTCYGANPRPDALMKEQLVEMTNLSPRVIRVWFQNKRCKDKKRALMIKQMQEQHEKVCIQTLRTFHQTDLRSYLKKRKSVLFSPKLVQFSDRENDKLYVPHRLCFIVNQPNLRAFDIKARNIVFSLSEPYCGIFFINSDIFCGKFRKSRQFPQNCLWFHFRKLALKMAATIPSRVVQPVW